MGPTNADVVDLTGNPTGGLPAHDQLQAQSKYGNPVEDKGKDMGIKNLSRNQEREVKNPRSDGLIMNEGPMKNYLESSEKSPRRSRRLKKNRWKTKTIARNSRKIDKIAGSRRRSRSRKKPARRSTRSSKSTIRTRSRGAHHRNIFKATYKKMLKKLNELEVDSESEGEEEEGFTAFAHEIKSSYTGEQLKLSLIHI